MTEFCVLWAVSSAMVQFCLHLQALALHYSITLTLCSVGSHSAHYCGRLPGHFGSLATQEAYHCLSILGSCHKYHFCHDERRVLSRQKCACSIKAFVMTDICIKVFCHGKHPFVATKDASCRDQHVFGSTKVSLSQQNFCCNKYLSSQKFCRSKSFVPTGILLS